MNRRGEDLQRAKIGLCHVFEGVRRLEQAAVSILEKVEAVSRHLTEPRTLRRVAAAGRDAVLEAAAREVQAAAAKPPRPASPPEPPMDLRRCGRHGAQPWQHTIFCTVCGRVFQLLNASAAHFAREVCPCGARLLPGLRVGRHSAAPICTACFVEIAASGGRVVRRAE